MFVSRRMISDRTGTLLDDMDLDAVGQALRRQVFAAETMGEVANSLRHQGPLAA